MIHSIHHLLKPFPHFLMGAFGNEKMRGSERNGGFAHDIATPRVAEVLHVKTYLFWSLQGLTTISWNCMYMVQVLGFHPSRLAVWQL